MPKKEITLNKLADIVEKGFKKVDKRFEQVDKRFEQVDKRFEQVDKRFEQVDKRFDGIDKRLGGMDKHFEQADKRLDDTDQKIVNLTGGIEALAGIFNREFTRFSSELAEQRKMINDIQTGLDNLSKKFERLDHELTANVGAHDRFEERILKPEEELQELKTKVFLLKKK